MPIDNTERDSASPEDLAPEELQRLVLPDGWSSYDRFACAVSLEAFRGWVKQPSPSCAAAALAGALNVVYGYSRGMPQAYTTMGILSVYQVHFNDVLIRQRRQLAAAIGEPALVALEASMQAALEGRGLEYGGVGDHKVTKAILRRSLRECLASILPSFTELDGASKMESIEESSIDVVVDDDNDDPIITSDDAAPPQVQGAATADPPLASLVLYFHRMDGVAKLARQSKPSTAMCGNVALLDAASYIHSTSDASCHPIARLRATCLMGKASSACKLRLAISASDSLDKQTRDWKVLWNTFTDDRTALVVHLKNHYAMVFALREWKCASTNEWTRQLFTARRGQRPTTWLHWGELRDTFLAWTGYKILAFAGSPPGDSTL